MTNLFRSADFTLASGRHSVWKIDCDALTDDDWVTLAALATTKLPPFSDVEGVPTGGLKFAAALERHIVPGAGRLLIADDVLTTGGSMEAHRKGRLAMGVAVFGRGPPPGWVRCLFRLHDEG